MVLKKFINYCENHDTLKKIVLTNKEKLKTVFDVYKKELNNFSEILKIKDIYFNERFKYNKDEKFNDDFKSPSKTNYSY